MNKIPLADQGLSQRWVVTPEPEPEPHNSLL